MLCFKAAPVWAFTMRTGSFVVGMQATAGVSAQGMLEVVLAARLCQELPLHGLARQPRAVE